MGSEITKSEICGHDPRYVCLCALSCSTRCSTTKELKEMNKMMKMKIMNTSANQVQLPFQQIVQYLWDQRQDLYHHQLKNFIKRLQKVCHQTIWKMKRIEA